MTNTNKIQGRKAKRNGKVFEQYVERSCIRYRRKGIADIKKTPEPMRPVGVLDQRRGIFKAVYEKKGQPDFLGTLRGGRSVMIEAKHTDAKRIAFDRILSQQETDLQNTMDLGGLALVLISFSMKQFYCVEWFVWQEMKDNIGKKSVNETDLEPFEVKFENGHIDFFKRSHVMDKIKEFIKKVKCSLKGHGPSTPLEKKIYTEDYVATRFGSKCEKCGTESWSNDLIYRG